MSNIVALNSARLVPLQTQLPFSGRRCVAPWTDLSRLE
jgi:hypothetical protein